MKKVKLLIAAILTTVAANSCRSTKTSTADIHTYNDSLAINTRQTLIDRIDSLIRTDQFTIFLDSLSIATTDATLRARSARITGKTASLRTTSTRISETDSSANHSTATKSAKSTETSVRQAVAPSFPLLRILAAGAIAVVILAIALKIKRKK